MAVVERKVGVASGGGMRLKARLSRPPPAGTYPPGLHPASDREKLARTEDRRGLWDWRRAIVAESVGRAYHARASRGI